MKPKKKSEFSHHTEEGMTDFGFERVPEAEKARKVAHVFHQVANQYDLMNDLMSFGIHRLWKRFVIELASVKPGQRILDLAGGTGDLTARFVDQVGTHGMVVLADINDAMLWKGRDRLLNQGKAKPIVYVQADAEKLPFTDNTFDVITMAFGLRNVTHQEAALRSMHQVLAPGGKVLILEFSTPVISSLKPLYDAYSFKVLPFLGKWVAGDADSYRYLAESIRKHPNQETLRQKMMDAGFVQCDYHNLTAGIVAVHRGYKA